MITLYLTEPKAHQYVLSTATGEVPVVAKPLELTRNGVVLNVRSGMTVVKDLAGSGIRGGHGHFRLARCCYRLHDSRRNH